MSGPIPRPNTAPAAGSTKSIGQQQSNVTKPSAAGGLASTASKSAPRPTPSSSSAIKEDHSEPKDEGVKDPEAVDEVQGEENKKNGEEFTQEYNNPLYNENFWDELKKLLEPKPQQPSAGVSISSAFPDYQSNSHEHDPQQFSQQMQQLAKEFAELHRKQQEEINKFCGVQKEMQKEMQKNSLPTGSKSSTENKDITREFTDYLKGQDEKNKNTKYSDAINKLNPDHPEAAKDPEQREGAYKTLKEGMNSYIKDKILDNAQEESADKLNKLQDKGNIEKLQQLSTLDKQIKEGMKHQNTVEKQGIFKELAKQMDPAHSMREGPEMKKINKEEQDKKLDGAQSRRPQSALLV